MLIPFVDGFENDNSVEDILIYQDQFAVISTSDGILKVTEFFPNEVLGKLLQSFLKYPKPRENILIYIYSAFLLLFTPLTSGTLTLSSRNNTDNINIECSKTTISNSNNFISKLQISSNESTFILSPSVLSLLLLFFFYFITNIYYYSSLSWSST